MSDLEQNHKHGYGVDEKYVYNDFDSVEHSVHQTGRGNVSVFRRFVSSFKPVERVQVGDANLTKAQRAIAGTAVVPLKKSLSAYHLSAQAIAGSIGAGLWISTGSSLHEAGPAGVLIAYFVMGVLIFTTMNTLGELGVRYDVAGVFSAYNSRFVDRSWGFSLGWTYALYHLTSTASELCSAAVALDFWSSDNNGATNVNKAAWVSLFFVFIVVINSCSVRVFGESEVVFAVIKVLGVVGFCIVGIVIAAGGGPDHNYLGARYWHDPGAFANGGAGVMRVLVIAAYSYSNTELSVLTSYETKSPKDAIPRAVRQVSLRIALFYLVSVTIMGFLVPWTEPLLTQANGASASPFVIAIRNAGIRVLPSILNVVVLLSVISVANANTYCSSRTMQSLAVQGLAPQFLMDIDREGRPVYANLITFAFALLGFLAATPKYGLVFTWLSSLSGLSSIVTWGSINLCHIRNRMAMKRRGLGTEDLEFSAPGGYIQSVVGLVLSIAVLGVQFWTALWPQGYRSLSSSGRANIFFQTWTAGALILFLFVGHKLVTRDWWWVRLDDIDVFTGVRIKDPNELREVIRAERERNHRRPWAVRAFTYWC